MPAGFPIELPLFPIRLSSLSFQTLAKPQAIMGSQGPAPKRPFCLRCSKPARLCLCSRLCSPPLDNPIAVTVLQHALERSHPLNSARIAKLGLANIALVSVSDVHSVAHFLITPLAPKPLLDPISITVERAAKADLSAVLAAPAGEDARSNGFIVKKVQRKQLGGGGTEEFRDVEEFEVVMPPGSALLFPSDKAVSLERLDFEVKHLVVLDGTWAKARRMYYENPWLKLMPHLRLDGKGESLYSEVRHQPKAGCLSTLESIVCAMKALGGDAERLDELLDVFESMIGDQRRCKDEKFRAMSQS